MKKFVPALLFLTLFFAAFQGSISANPFTATQKSIAPPPVVGTPGGIQQQLKVKEKLSSYFYSLEKKRSVKSTLILLVLSFLYGLLHALGPGHRKTVLFSLFLTRKSKVYEPLGAGLIGAVLHAFSSVALVFSIYLATRKLATISQHDTGYALMEGITFSLLFVFSVYLVVSHLLPGHHHKSERKGKNLLLFILLSSLVPCPGATMILLMGIYLGLTSYALASVAAMSMGMAVIMISVSYLAYGGRTGLFTALGEGKKGGVLLRKIGQGVELCSFLFIAAFSGYMSFPFIHSLVNMI